MIVRILGFLSMLLLPLVFAAEEAQISAKPSLLSDALIIFGSIFVFLSSLGILRFPDFYSRLHSSSKLLTFGGLSIFIGAAIAFHNLGIFERMLLVTFFFFLTAPLSSYMIARSGYLRGIPPHKEPISQDQWQACGDANAIPIPSEATELKQPNT